MARLADIARVLLCAAPLLACRPGPVGSPQTWAVEDNQQGAVALARGDLSSAEQWFAMALEGSRSVDDRRGMAVAWLNLSRVDAARWDLDRADRRATDALALAHALDDAPLEGAALARRASIRSRRGRHDEAIADARAARQSVDAMHRRGLRGRSAQRRLAADRSATLGLVLARAGGAHCDEAAQVLSRASQGYRRRKDDAGHAAVAYGRGVLALGRGDSRSATEALSTALELDRARGRPLDVAADLDALAQAGAAQGDAHEAQALLMRAFDVREAVGATRQALATAERIDALGPAPADLKGRVALVRAELRDAPYETPADALPCG